MILSLLVIAAASVPLGVWPEASAPPVTTVSDVEFYLAEPEDDYFLLAVQPLLPPLAGADRAALAALAAQARRLGAEAVILLGELDGSAIPDDPDEALPVTGRFAAATFVVFASDEGGSEERGPLRGALKWRGEERGRRSWTNPASTSAR